MKLSNFSVVPAWDEASWLRIEVKLSNSLGSIVLLLPFSLSRTAGNIAPAIATACNMGLSISRASSTTWFSSISTFQLNSAISSAPTILPLPFRVWKPRRISVLASILLVSFNHKGRDASITSKTLSNSSRKISRISSSTTVVLVAGFSTATFCSGRALTSLVASLGPLSSRSSRWIISSSRPLASGCWSRDAARNISRAVNASANSS